MKLFDAYAALQEIEEQEGTPASSASSASKSRPLAQKEAKEAEEAAPLVQFPKKPALVLSDEFRHGTTFDGTPKTWTGKIVSLDAWRQLSEWERHGPDGRHWNGITRRWEVPK